MHLSKASVILVGLCALASHLILTSSADKLRGLQVQRPSQERQNVTSEMNQTTPSAAGAGGRQNVTSGMNQTSPLSAGGNVTSEGNETEKHCKYMTISLHDGPSS